MSTKDEENRVEAARQLGMKLSEIIDVYLDDDGVVVETHDGNLTLIREDGSLEFRGKKPFVGEAGPVLIQAEKAAPKGRGRS